jgi:hypothetical protein
MESGGPLPPGWEGRLDKTSVRCNHIACLTRLERLEPNPKLEVVVHEAAPVSDSHRAARCTWPQVTLVLSTFIN